MKLTTIAVHETAVDGLPDMEKLVGRVAFIFDGCLVSGWPLTGEVAEEVRAQHGLSEEDGQMWEGNHDVANTKVFLNVTHWVELPQPAWELTAA